MPESLWSQDIFTAGELSPLMYARTSTAVYFNGMKTAKNVITFPQGAAGKRFGTEYLATLVNATTANQIFFKSFQYLNECTYLVVMTPDRLDVYLEGTINKTITGTGITAEELLDIDYTILENKFRITTGISAPKDITRSIGITGAISAVATNEFTFAGVIVTETIYALTFTWAAPPTTSPQIITGKTYFARATATNKFKVYSSSEDAKDDTNEYTLTTIGTTAVADFLDGFAINNVSFRTYPTYDFTGGYDSLTFTPGAASGNDITLSSSAAIFTTAHVNGTFNGGGGSMRIRTYTNTMIVRGDILTPFDSTAAISGILSLLREPAWSDARGWPRKCSSYQNRSFFANTESLTNGVWGSTINDFEDFDDLESDDDSAISWFPTSDTVSYVNFIVPYRSLTIHTNSGVYSTPLNSDKAITPSNFSLSVQDTTPADSVQPRNIDNQILIMSGNDAHSLVWDGLNNSYTSSLVSVANEQVIRTPVDEASYIDIQKAGSRYMFIVNADGSLAVYQTLISEKISGWTPCVTEQSWGSSYFRWVTSDSNGNLWFVVERNEAGIGAAYNITGYTSDSLTSTGSIFSVSGATLCTFITTGTLPVSVPQIQLLTNYWAVGIDANTYRVYLTKTDAEEDVNRIEFTSSGTNSQVQRWSLSNQFYIEKLDFDLYMDCSQKYSGAPVSSIPNVARMNGQNVQIHGDEYGFADEVGQDEASVQAHGEIFTVSTAQVGYPINVEIQPMPLSLSLGSNIKTTNLAQPKHIRTVTFMFNNTVGGTINGIPIAIKNFDEVNFGTAPTPAQGTFKMNIMKGWDDFHNPTFTINHSEPFDMKLLGVFYALDA